MEVNKQAIISGLGRLSGFCCELCRGPVDTGSLCPGCVADLPRINHACEYCGQGMAIQGVCGACLGQIPAFDRCVCAFHYRYPVNLLLQNIKYKQRLTALPPLARALVQQILTSGRPKVERLLPVPMSWERSFDRGMNHALEIGKLIGRDLGLPCDTRSLKRTRHTRPMHNLDTRQRRLNVKNAFAYTGGPGVQSVAIIDDIITTGATLNEIAELLKGAGIGRVEVWALSRAT